MPSRVSRCPDKRWSILTSQVTCALRLQRRHRFDNHLAIYLIVNLAIWPVVGLAWQFWYPWSRLPPAAWGIGLAFHAWFTFGPPNQPITEATVGHEIAVLTSRSPTQPQSLEPPTRRMNYWTAVSEPDRTDRLDAGLDERPRDLTHLPGGGE